MDSQSLLTVVANANGVASLGLKLRKLFQRDTHEAAGHPPQGNGSRRA
jgi:hypothetical protein